MNIHEIIEQDRRIVISNPYRGPYPFLWIGNEQRRRVVQRIRNSNIVKRMLLAVRGCTTSSEIPLRCNRGIETRRMRVMHRVR